jgi:GAF domain-containing protein
VSISVFSPSPTSPNESRREEAVIKSGALQIRDDDVLQGIVEETRACFKAQVSAVSIIHQDWQYLIAASGVPIGVYSRRTSLCAHTVASSSPLLYVADARRDQRFAGNPAVEDGRLCFYAAAQVRSDACCIGTLCVIDSGPRLETPGTRLDQLTSAAEAVTERLRCLRSGGS